MKVHRTLGSGFIFLSLIVFAVMPALATELTILTMPHDQNPEKQAARVEAWKAAFPEYAGIQVNIVGGRMDELKVMTAGGIPPDIVFFSSSQIPEYVFNGLLEELDGFIERDPGFQLGGMIPSVMQAVRYKDRTYGVPTHWSAVATMYNADLLASRGLEAPGVNWTWDDLVDYGKRTTFDHNGDGELDHFGFGDHWIHHHRWPYWVWSAGGDFYNEDLTESRLNSPEAIRGIEFMASLYGETRIAAKVIGNQIQEPGVSVTSTGHAISSELFQQGRMAFFNTTRFSYPPNAPFDVGVLPPPMGPSSRTSVMVADFYGIHPHSQQKQLAWDFISFASQPENALLGFDAGTIGALSARTEAAIAMLQDAPEIDAMNWVHTAEDAQRPSLYHPAASMISINWNGIARSEVSVREAVEEAVRTHNATLRQLWNDGNRW